MWQRWNQTTHIFENSTDDGGSWVPTPLSGSIISEGTVVDARLSSNVALKNIDNQFSADQTINKTRAELRLQHTGSTMYNRHQQYVAGNAGWFVNARFNGTGFDLDDIANPGNLCFSIVDPTRAFEWYTMSAGANPRTVTGIFQILRSGAFFERGRTTAVGEWLDYTPTVTITSGGGTLSGGSLTGQYIQIGRSLWVDFAWSNFTVNTATVTEFALSIPVTVAATSTGGGSYFDAAAWNSALVYTAAGETRVRIQRHNAAAMPVGAGQFVRASMLVRF